jgi:hypothetical protein
MNVTKEKCKFELAVLSGDLWQQQFLLHTYGT